MVQAWGRNKIRRVVFFFNELMKGYLRLKEGWNREEIRDDHGEDRCLGTVYRKHQVYRIEENRERREKRDKKREKI